MIGVIYLYVYTLYPKINVKYRRTSLFFLFLSGNLFKNFILFCHCLVECEKSADSPAPHSGFVLHRMSITESFAST
jgi:hypothetical protein